MVQRILRAGTRLRCFPARGYPTARACRCCISSGGWPRRIRSAAAHAISLTDCPLTTALGWAAQSLNPRLLLRAEFERLQQEIQLLREETRILAIVEFRTAPTSAPSGSRPSRSIALPSGVRLSAAPGSRQLLRRFIAQLKGEFREGGQGLIRPRPANWPREAGRVPERIPRRPPLFLTVCITRSVRPPTPVRCETGACQRVHGVAMGRDLPTWDIGRAGHNNTHCLSP